MVRECIVCGFEYDDLDRRGQPGRITECEDCAEEDEVLRTGNMIYDHKTGASIQINSNPELTRYINKATELRKKASNLGLNAKVDGPRKNGGCLITVAGSNAKGKK